MIYVPDVGHGFVKDDFRWISDARQPLSAALTHTNGFYRPLVTMSFRADYQLFGLHSYPYGLTNLALAAACAALVFWLGRSFALSAGASVFGAAVWAFNFHGINMSVLWISGRTALLMTLFALLAGIAFIRNRKVLCLLCVLAALLSKEEAVLLPFALLSWHVVLGGNTRARQRWSSAVKDAWWLMLPLAAYAVARLRTDAMTPFDAPDFYAFTFGPVAFGRNLLEYFDRSWTFALAGLALLWAVAHSTPNVEGRRTRVAICGLVWFASALAITVFLPVRSSLYACWPSTGAALFAAAVADGWIERMTARRANRTAFAAVLALTVLIPVYRARNDRWVEIADLSRETMATLDRCSDAGCDSILMEDDPHVRRNFASTFGTFDTAARLFLGRDILTRVLSGPDGRQHMTDGNCVLHIRLVEDVPDSEVKGTCG